MHFTAAILRLIWDVFRIDVLLQHFPIDISGDIVLVVSSSQRNRHIEQCDDRARIRAVPARSYTTLHHLSIEASPTVVRGTMREHCPPVDVH